jgi:Flp pilus assembly pilin Flp
VVLYLFSLLWWIGSKIESKIGTEEEGQTTAEYALVILAAAAVAVVLITWAQTSGKLPQFFDTIIDSVAGNAQ